MKLCSLDPQKKKNKRVAILAPDFFEVENSSPSAVNKEEKIVAEVQDISTPTPTGYIDPNIDRKKIIRPKPNIKINKRSITSSIYIENN